jgi:hypothetical protein
MNGIMIRYPTEMKAPDIWLLLSFSVATTTSYRGLFVHVLIREREQQASGLGLGWNIQEAKLVSLPQWVWPLKGEAIGF